MSDPAGTLDSGPQKSVVPRGRRPSAAPATVADYDLRILWPLIRWIEKNHWGPDAIDRLTAGTGVRADAFDLKSHWTSLEAFETILARARALMPDDETFKRAGAYRIKGAYGPIRYLLWAASPGAVYAQSVKTYRLICTVGKP